MKKMNPEVKKMWVDALRSGEFEQANGALREIDFDEDGKKQVSYCCLGVLSELHRRKMKKSADNYDFSNGYPKDFVLNWAGLEPANQACNDVRIKKTGDSLVTAAELNDDGYSFHKIAALIDRNL